MLLVGILLHSVLPLSPMPVSDPKPAFTFSGQAYYHRYSKDAMHEFTPKGQSDLQKWTDMVTINGYSNAKDGEALAAKANVVLEAYKANKAMVVKTDSVPRTSSKPAEHLIVVLFPRPTFIEAAFTRFVMDKGVGKSIAYSHRIYGAKAGDPMSQWLQQNGDKTEKALMKMPIPAVKP